MHRLILFLVMLSLPLCAVAQTSVCDSLNPRQLERARTIMDSEYLYDCCDQTISECLKARPPCSLAQRLADNVCRRVGDGQSDTDIRRALSRRARSMVGSGQDPVFDLTEAPSLGDQDAPVVVVVYACPRCPYCSRLIPSLVEEIESGSLKGKARLVFRVFPIRGHERSTELGLAFEAAARMDHFWPYMKATYTDFESFTDRDIEQRATEIGLDSGEFKVQLADPDTRQMLVASKKEGLANGVEETPTFFVNRRLWVADLTLDELIDGIEEAYEREARLRATRS